MALIGLAADCGTLVLFTSAFGWHYLVGTTSGFLFGLAVVYVLSERYVFSDPEIASPLLRFLVFGLIGIIGLLLLSMV